MRSVDSMVAEFNKSASNTNPGILVDFDHFSHDRTKPSEAAGWITELQGRDSGLWAKIRWSDVGEAAVKGGRYRNVSPVWLPEECESLESGNYKNRSVIRVRPLKLHRLALTNDPNIKGMIPLSNRTDDNNQKENKKVMKNVCLSLGLAAEANEDSVLSAVNALQNKCRHFEEALQPIKNRVTELENQNKELLALQVESDLEKYANRIKPETKESVRQALLTNRASTISLLESIAPAETPPGSTVAPMVNRQNSKAPTVQNKATEQMAKVTEYRNRTGVTFQQAWDACTQANPELFKSN